jgi:hypothetical protein
MQAATGQSPLALRHQGSDAEIVRRRVLAIRPADRFVDVSAKRGHDEPIGRKNT